MTLGGAVSPTPHINGETRETHTKTTPSPHPARTRASQQASLLRIAKWGARRGRVRCVQRGASPPMPPFAFPGKTRHVCNPFCNATS